MGQTYQFVSSGPRYQAELRDVGSGKVVFAGTAKPVSDPTQAQKGFKKFRSNGRETTILVAGGMARIV